MHHLRSDVTAGVLLLVATVTALVVANSPAATVYERVRDYAVGPRGLHLRLTLGEWAADGLLAIFFFVVGWSSKRSSWSASYGIRVPPRFPLRRQ